MNSAMIVKEIPINEIYIDADLNCRGDIIPFEVVELARSIEKNGLLEPVAVQPWVANPPFKYRLLMGYRRHKAHLLLKRETIPCVIKDNITDLQARILNLQENLERKNLNTLQEALAIKRFKDAGHTIQEVAHMVNVSQGWVQIRYALLSLPNEIQQAAAAGFLTQEQIKDIYSMPNKEMQFEAVKKIKDSRLKGEKRALKVKKPKVNPLQKRHRKREEIFAMMEHIQDSLGNSLGTRCLAWAAGEINTMELYSDLQEVAKEKGIPYHIPLEELANIN